jgi:hypothetical protein
MDEEVIEGIVEEVRQVIDNAISELSLDQAIETVQGILEDISLTLDGLRDDKNRQLGG